MRYTSCLALVFLAALAVLPARAATTARPLPPARPTSSARPTSAARPASSAAPARPVPGVNNRNPRVVVPNHPAPRPAARPVPAGFMTPPVIRIAPSSPMVYRGLHDTTNPYHVVQCQQCRSLVDREVLRHLDAWWVGEQSRELNRRLNPPPPPPHKKAGKRR